MPELEANIAVCRRFYDYLNARATSDWSDMFAADWTAVPALPNVPDQISGYRTTIDQFRAGAPDLKVETIEMIANDDVVAVRSHVSGTNTGELFGQPATGRAFNFTAIDIYRVSDGKFVSAWHVEDFAKVSARLSNPGICIFEMSNHLNRKAIS